MTSADLVWNRAIEGAGVAARAGDRALSALLLAHGLTMNGGLPHACEAMTDAEREAAAFGYRFFGFDAVAKLFSAPGRVLSDEDEERSNDAYAAAIPDDGTLVQRFETHFAAHPDQFAPLGSR